jgi:DNA anti-recombination protein RmuC
MSEKTQENLFLPALLITLAVLVWFSFQTTQLYQERTNLANLSSNQEAIYQNAQKMRSQLDLLAAGTQKLASAGNKNAQAMVTALQQRGVTINPDVKKPE